MTSQISVKRGKGQKREMLLHLLVVELQDTQRDRADTGAYELLSRVIQSLGSHEQGKSLPSVVEEKVDRLIV